MDNEFEKWDASEAKDIITNNLFQYGTLCEVLRKYDWLMEEVAEYANEDESNDIMTELGYMLDIILSNYENEYVDLDAYDNEEEE